MVQENCQTAFVLNSVISDETLLDNMTLKQLRMTKVEETDGTFTPLKQQPDKYFDTFWITDS